MKLKMKYLILCMILFLSSGTYGEDLPKWFYKSIKVREPNQLSYFVAMSEKCPFTKESLDEIVDGVLIRSRIKPLEGDIFIKNRIYLNLEVWCLPLQSQYPVFSIRANFARYYPYPSIIIDQDLGSSGVGSEYYIKQAFKESVEDAVTAHIKANFDR